LRGFDTEAGYFFDVDTVLGGGGHVGGGEFVEKGLVFGDHFGDGVMVDCEAHLCGRGDGRIGRF